MSIAKDLHKLVNSGVISQETAENISNYYRIQTAQSSNRLFVVFGILGSILIGLGIILILAHNWDEFSRGMKTIFAFLPLLIAQMLCLFVILKRYDSTAWRESVTAFSFFSVGANIALISQIYHISGSTGPFLLTWMLLCLPLIYMMKSSVTSLLYIAGITWFACETGYWSYQASVSYFYWLLLMGAFAHYYVLYKEKPESNFTVFHNWLIPLSLVISLGIVANASDELMFIAYFSLFGLMYAVGNLEFFSQQKIVNNGYRVLGSTGTIVLLLILSFDWFWDGLRRSDLPINVVISSPEFFVSAFLTLLTLGLFYFQQKSRPLSEINPIAVVFILFIAIFIVGMSSPMAVIFINIIVFVIGVYAIRTGAKQNNLGELNYGMLIITFLVVCRFFDADLSFVLRGLLFVAVGAGFIAANSWMLKKRKNEE